MLPSMFLLPETFKFSSAATPLQTILARYLSGRILPLRSRKTFFGNPRVQQPHKLLRFLGPQYFMGIPSPFSFKMCQWCWTRLKMNCTSFSYLCWNSCASV